MHNNGKSYKYGNLYVNINKSRNNSQLDSNQSGSLRLDVLLNYILISIEKWVKEKKQFNVLVTMILFFCCCYFSFYIILVFLPATNENVVVTSFVSAIDEGIGIITVFIYLFVNLDNGCVESFLSVIKMKEVNMKKLNLDKSVLSSIESIDTVR